MMDKRSELQRRRTDRATPGESRRQQVQKELKDRQEDRQEWLDKNREDIQQAIKDRQKDRQDFIEDLHDDYWDGHWGWHGFPMVKVLLLGYPNPITCFSMFIESGIPG